jgi:hypothetical protein
MNYTGRELDEIVARHRAAYASEMLSHVVFAFLCGVVASFIVYVALVE